MADRPINLLDASDLIEVNGAHPAYDLAGCGPPIILMHAGICDRRMWDDQFAVLTVHHRVLRYDLRGFGKSTHPPGAFAHHDDLRALMDVLDFEQATLMGVSLGGRIALRVALIYPE